MPKKPQKISREHRTSTTLWVDKELLKDVKIAAVEDGITMAEFIERCLESGLEARDRLMARTSDE